MRAYCVLISALWCLSASAVEFPISWTADANASHYRLEASYDNGSTWTYIDTNIQQASITVDVREATTALFRISTCYADGLCDRDTGSGVWVKVEEDDTLS